MGLGRVKPFEKRGCPVTNCELTSDRSLLSQADLVLVHMFDRLDRLPTGDGAMRPAKQRWVFVAYESPTNSPDFSKFNGVFNLTSTYRLDSDFSCNRDAFEWKPNSGDFVEAPLVEWTSRKTSVAVISNCGSPTKRLDYIREMQKYISVDLFGGCGQPCPSKFTHSGLSSDCKTVLGHEYKFYLAFENSFCRDYVTEKFFLEFKFKIIAVTMGAGPYDIYVSSFI